MLLFYYKYISFYYFSNLPDKLSRSQYSWLDWYVVVSYTLGLYAYVCCIPQIL